MKSGGPSIPQRGQARAATLLALAVLLAGCQGVPVPGEQEGRRQVQAVGDLFRPRGQRPDVSMIAPGADLGALLRFAMLHQPRVESAYFNWLGSVERITVERSLPDPQLTFEADIADVVMSVMPGFMQLLPGRGKLTAAGRMATAESQVRYFEFESAVLQTAADVKRACYTLRLLDDRLRIGRETARLLAQGEQAIRERNAVGLATLQDGYRIHSERDQLAAELANLEESRRPLMAQLRGALGLTPDQPDPAVPPSLATTPLGVRVDDLLIPALERNPRLKALAAEVRLAEESIALAARAKAPDLTLGLAAEVKASPLMVRPQAGLSLPVWRDKIAAQIAQAEAGRRSAEARLTGEQIGLVVEMALGAYDFHEATRDVILLQTQLIPAARQSRAIALSGFHSGQVDFLALLETERAVLTLQRSEAEARTRREIILSDLSLVTAGLPPPGAPLLPLPPLSSTGEP